MNKDYEAIWQFDREEGTDINTDNTLSGIYTFIYENNSLVINLPSESPIAGLPEDNIYRIKIKWKENELYIFPPLGNRWEKFATWENGHFVMYGGKKKKIFKKIKPAEIAKWQQDLVKEDRKMWGYPYLNPDDIEI